EYFPVIPATFVAAGPQRLFHHLVGAGKKRRRDFDAERSCCLQVDDEFVFGGLLDRQIGRLGALEDLSRVSANQAKGSCEARSIADQATGTGELAPRIYRRN